MVYFFFFQAEDGIRDLTVTGVQTCALPISYPEATAVFDIDSIGLTNLVYRLNHGLDPGNNPIGAPTQWAIGVGVNPGAVDLDRELSRDRKSTRLNSSHSQISYAVFCLKKKKKR